MINEIERKKKFAELVLYEPGEVYKAALTVYADDPGYGLQIAEQWAETDAEVAQLKEELIAKYGERHFMPSKEKITREVLDIGRQKDIEARTRLAAYRLIAEILGYIERPQTNVNTNVSVSHHRVMSVPNFSSQEQFEQRAIEQQAKLIEHASSEP